jgi:hypothetical protein
MVLFILKNIEIHELLDLIERISVITINENSDSLIQTLMN